jgi:hypothetical protein
LSISLRISSSHLFLGLVAIQIFITLSMFLCQIYVHSKNSGTWGSVVVKWLLVGRSRDRSPVASLGIFSEATDGTMCPGVDSASKNEYQENSWG